MPLQKSKQNVVSILMMVIIVLGAVLIICGVDSCNNFHSKTGSVLIASQAQVMAFEQKLQPNCFPPPSVAYI